MINTNLNALIIEESLFYRNVLHGSLRSLEIDSSFLESGDNIQYTLEDKNYEDDNSTIVLKLKELKERQLEQQNDPNQHALLDKVLVKNGFNRTGRKLCTKDNYNNDNDETVPELTIKQLEKKKQQK